MADKLFELKIITPDRTFFAGDSTMVELNTTEGQVGIYADHAPTAMVLEPALHISMMRKAMSRRQLFTPVSLR